MQERINSGLDYRFWVGLRPSFHVGVQEQWSLEGRRKGFVWEVVQGSLHPHIERVAYTVSLN